MSLALEFQNVGKQYRLGEVGVGTIVRDVERIWAKLRGKRDPNLAEAQRNDREVAGGDYIWALRDINLTINQGEVFGIIGRNGAGKSTLLKLLSRITAPTTGRIRTRGRISSLLEVGTGFHPELTGRENIFLNGAILGMTRQQIRRHLDEIVEFSGCAKYIDTPVKRYSSGMTVRLGFAVAAHLECEILVIDEVLAVGDATFQKKCIGRMSEVASGGKTVLFVSHNMQSVEQLCTQACVIDRGRLSMVGEVSDAITEYFGAFSNRQLDLMSTSEGTARHGSGAARFQSICIQDTSGKDVSSLTKGDPARIVFTAQAHSPLEKLDVSIRFYSGLTRQQVTSIQSPAIQRPVQAGEIVSFAVEFDTTHFRPGVYPLKYGLGDGQDPLAFDSAEDVTRPLSIVGDGKGRIKGLMDVDSRIVAEAARHKQDTAQL